ncbi:hypothetical protein ASPWEDRAFT_747212 [Aspergillus wentii DTO 134E9]|uniref:Pyridoxal-dependent decarboxylase domain protein n=1 Tax=Aspergillus wentii DTO 134E9 TaxID=1073089 RepID=A0A1L9R8T1_ASPWE|nr:uncharacterized protein ASPWEDRAFT_747212 [Aspergillus wentii DTO 134E9]OJJ31330.1 hypothetical protein ASPWEDRAFT_747212 [Aspergillus wentii DTO 134E9]
MSFEGTKQFNVINSYFIGPKAANLPDFRANINTILDELLEARMDYWPADNHRKFIPKDVRTSEEFRRVRDNVSDAVRKVAALMGKHSVPFWSPRYQGHMCTDLTMPSMLGYFMTMIYNPNNVALEASPITTVAELKVGQQLCELFGYNIKDEPLPWGHITCDGTVANLESIWVARNLKFYPLALKWAIEKGKLQFIKDEFKVHPCSSDLKNPNEKELFVKMDNWTLLNLRPETVLGLPEALGKEFGISTPFLESALEEYNIQTGGRGPLEEYHKLPKEMKEMKYLLGTTRHYSWPKGLAIAGIGSGNLTEIEVDLNAHINIKKLDEQLHTYAKKKIPVYAVVAIIGSTEEGAVDRLSQIVKIRKTLQEKYGMSFLIHADAAWGGYFSTMIDKEHPELIGKETKYRNFKKGPVPALTLKKDTEEDLFALKDADSITVDPHKAGYVPYPAGSLVYRDGRMRHLVTWSSPYLSQGSSENIGVYGVEGSKPGAAAMSTWLSNKTIGLDPHGYGMLLGEAAFTSARTVVHGVEQETPIYNKDFICVPFNRLRCEKDDGKPFSSPEFEEERNWIREHILGKENGEIMKNNDAMERLRELGSDLNINAFALNWYYEDGTLNTDLEEANYLMKRVVDRLSIISADTDPSQIPLYLTSTKFEPKLYGKCAQNFMSRLGVKPCKQDLFVLRNVVMSPFPTQQNFIGELMECFEEVVRDEVKNCRKRNSKDAHDAKFIIRGTKQVYLDLQTSFHTATLRQQLIVAADLLGNLKAHYDSLVDDKPEETMILEAAEKIDLKAMIGDLSTAQFKVKVYSKENPASFKEGEVKLTKIVKSRPLNTLNRDTDYPENNTPFYLYGVKNEPEEVLGGEQQEPPEAHVSHILLKAPNIALSANGVTFDPPLDSDTKNELPNGLILTLSKYPEAAMQPFPSSNKDLPPSFFFRSNRKYDVKVWKDPKAAEAEGPGLLKDLENPDNGPMYEGKMTLGLDVDVDAAGPNLDKIDADKKLDCTKWQKELDSIGNVLNGNHVDSRH